MKKLIISLGMLLLLSVISSAQVTAVIVSMYGEYDVVVEAANGQYAVVSQWGEIKDLNMEGRANYYSDFWDYEAGKIEKIGNVKFAYYSDFWDYEAGKVKKIGNANFSYKSDFWDYEAGKLGKAGNLNISYFSDFWDYEAGKVKTIGNIKFEYDRSGRLSRINNKSLPYRQSHRPSNDYWYSPGQSSVPSFGRPGANSSRPEPGRPQPGRPGVQSGNHNRRPAPSIVAEVHEGNITIYVTDGRQPW